MPSSPQHPASGFRAAFFAKRPSLDAYPFESTHLLDSKGPQKSFNSPIYSVIGNFLIAVKFFSKKDFPGGEGN